VPALASRTLKQWIEELRRLKKLNAEITGKSSMKD
jgi:hypothetical protein